MTKRDPKEIAGAYVSKYENHWNSDGPPAVANLYAQDSLLVGNAIAICRAEIEKLLGTIFDQGWSKISIKAIESREIRDVVLVANDYSPHVPGPPPSEPL